MLYPENYRYEITTNYIPSENASTYNTKFQKTIQQIIDEIQARRDWIGVDWVEDTSENEDESGTVTKDLKKTVRLLDYACGTGLVSRVRNPLVLLKNASNKIRPSHRM